jgi:S1-C subfamily serine protease
VKLLAAIGICLLAAMPAIAQRPPSSQTSVWTQGTAPASAAYIHPSVVRIVAPGEGSVSYGSGTLVYVNEQAGLVITNWHVINEATGPISVHFPDGFYSLGTVEQIDRDWDLAVIAIRKPNAQPVPLANEAPRPGELLTIAGYGSGNYRAASGRCTQYVAPGTSFPFEMVEVAVSARQGDSGGPIFNEKGELAGVLFGEGHGRTSGSYCGRVRWFLAGAMRDSPARPSAIAETAPLRPIPSRTNEESRVLADAVALPSSPLSAQGSNSGGRNTFSAPPPPPNVAVVAQVESGGNGEVLSLGWEDVAGDTLGQQAKTVLAIVGVLAIILHALRFLSGERGKA